MTIAWTPTTTPLNIESKEATVSVVRTDSEDPDNIKTYTVPLAPIGTGPEKLAVANEIWNKHQAEITHDSNVSAFVDQFNTELKENLEAREG